jgi:hypothetical protein
MRWSPHSCVFRRRGDIANLNLGFEAETLSSRRFSSMLCDGTCVALWEK